MRRTIDLIIAVAALTSLSPLMIAIAIVIMIDSPGNPFYRARRVGKGGREFRMWKFRTMVIGADKMGSITGKRDPRVIRPGFVLRRTKLDELPQFLNLLLGNMTLVGPRPESPEIVALYNE